MKNHAAKPVSNWALAALLAAFLVTSCGTEVGNGRKEEREGVLENQTDTESTDNETMDPTESVNSGNGAGQVGLDGTYDLVVAALTAPCGSPLSDDLAGPLNHDLVVTGDASLKLGITIDGGLSLATLLISRTSASGVSQTFVRKPSLGAGILLLENMGYAGPDVAGEAACSGFDRSGGFATLDVSLPGRGIVTLEWARLERSSSPQTFTLEELSLEFTPEAPSSLPSWKLELKRSP